MLVGLRVLFKEAMNLIAEQRDVSALARSFGRVAAYWLDASSRQRAEDLLALQVSTGLSARQVEAALHAVFIELTEDKILTFCRSEPGFQTPHESPRSILHVLPGNAFTAWLPGAVISLLLGAECTLKPSLREPVFASLWKRSIRVFDAELADRVNIVSWKEGLLARYDAVVAYGSDETLARLRAAMPEGKLFIGYGHKLSVAVIGKEALSPENLPTLIDAAEKAVDPFNLQGCLSPQIIFLEAEDPGLFEALYARVNVMPQFKRFEQWSEIKADLQDLKPYLSTIGYAGWGETGIEWRQGALEMGFSRLCPMGEMQQPPIGWRNGGISLLDALSSQSSAAPRSI
jgi:hypothetical protein